MGSFPTISRRQFGVGLSACALRAWAGPASCAEKWPSWATELRTDLDTIAGDLTSRAQRWQGPRRTVRPEDFGGHSANTKATAAIQSAIDAAAQQGGGTVLLSNGDYVSGTLDLRSNVRLQIGRGARLLGSVDLADYPPRIAARPTVMDSNLGATQSLIFAQGCENISLSGAGQIDGRGSRENFPGSETIGATPGRPFLIRVLDCKRVHVTGLHLRDAACWMQSYLNCEDLLVEGLTVENQANFNNDGLDIDGCRRVIVRNCFINSEDDGLCFKGASQRPMEDVLVENCRIYSTCNAVKFGTDSQGDFRRILVRNLEVGGPDGKMRSLNRKLADSGVSWEVVDGGTVEDILVRQIKIVRAQSPLFMRLGDRGRTRPEQPKPAPGRLRRVVFDGITGRDNGTRGSYFLGIPERSIEDVAIRDLRLSVGASNDPATAADSVGEMRSDYPDSKMLGHISPAYGLWTRHVQGLTLTDVRFAPSGHDSRPAVLTDMQIPTCAGSTR
jgi:hypothetical protein